MLYSFDDYIFEEYLKLDAPLYYSQPLKDTLSALANKGDKVARFLYYSEQSDENKSDITFVLLYIYKKSLAFARLFIFVYLRPIKE